MKKLFFALIAALAVLFSCQEWEPVLTLKYPEPAGYEKVNMDSEVNMTIAELKALYTKHNMPIEIEDEIIIKGQVVSSDESGNIYRELYIQDATGAIDVKIGKSSMYNDYKIGQWIYVNCQGLTLGEYGYKSGNNGGDGMLQLGMEDPTGTYETAYIDVQAIIDSHIFRGAMGTPIAPVELAEADVMKAENIGKYVTLRGLTYSKEQFALVYITPSIDTKAPNNRVFLSDQDWGITTWAFSKNKFLEYIKSGIWDTATVGSGGTSYGPITGLATAIDPDATETYKEMMIANAAAGSVSQYFKMGNQVIQIR
ncbi:MAG: hypothetical protein II130_04420, partial [Bacteroidales bacterium]|nr:hypothetical protein [Bacteroidales bacterium]